MGETAHGRFRMGQKLLRASGKSETLFQYIRHFVNSRSGVSEPRSCAKVDVTVLGSPTIIVLMVSLWTCEPDWPSVKALGW